MGKQKSFIIVGSTFLAFIIVLVAASLLTKNIKETEIRFIDEKYYMEVGSVKALAPNIYAGGDLKEDVILNYTVEGGNAISIEDGTYSSGSGLLFDWVVLENVSGETKERHTGVPYHEEDVITMGTDGYWYINGQKTKTAVKEGQSEEDIPNIFAKSTEKTNFLCYILNGIQTDILYRQDVKPVRDEATGNWFIDGKDTGYSYKGTQVTISALSVGEVTLKATGVVAGKEVSVSTVIEICLPNPKSLSLNYIDDTIVIKKGTSFDIDYKVEAHANAVAEPLQYVNVTDSSRSDSKNILQISGVAVTAPEAGKFEVKIAVDRSAFSEIGQYNGISKYLDIIVLDTTDEQITLINNARLAISEIEDLTGDEKLGKIVSARILVELVEEANKEAITNLSDLEKAEDRYLENE